MFMLGISLFLILYRSNSYGCFADNLRTCLTSTRRLSDINTNSSDVSHDYYSEERKHDTMRKSKIYSESTAADKSSFFASVNRGKKVPKTSGNIKQRLTSTGHKKQKRFRVVFLRRRFSFCEHSNSVEYLGCLIRNHQLYRTPKKKENKIQQKYWLIRALNFKSEYASRAPNGFYVIDEKKMLLRRCCWHSHSNTDASASESGN